MADGDATLYTYTFVYNTRTNVGEFSGGGILLNGENRLESQRGYYLGDDKLVAGVDEVQMRNEEYALKGDSVVYDLATDNAYFSTARTSGAMRVTTFMPIAGSIGMPIRSISSHATGIC